jgi:hypothetical protein
VPSPDERQETVPAIATRDVSVRIQELTHGATACVNTRQWTLRTLIAYLFDGRECDEVRAALARGEGVAHGSRLTWPPVEITADELSAIERTFPHEQPDRVLEVEAVVLAQLVVPADDPRTVVTVRPSHPTVAEVVPHAQYVRFDYGPWADVYLASLTRDQAMALLADSALGIEDATNVTSASLLAEEHESAIRLESPRADEQKPW